MLPCDLFQLIVRMSLLVQSAQWGWGAEQSEAEGPLARMCPGDQVVVTLFALSFPLRFDV